MSSKTIARNTPIRRSRNLLESEIDGDVIALSIDKGMCYGLNDVGSRIWRALDDWTDMDRIVGVLVDEFDVDEATCGAEVERLLNELNAENILEVGEPDQA